MHELEHEQGTMEWLKARAGMVTGTTFGRAVGTPAVQTTLLYEIMAGMMTEVKDEGFLSEAVQRGNDLEPIALKAACDTLKYDFQTMGMMISDEINSFGTSPDAVCRDVSGNVIGGIEIKCPNSKKHIEYIDKDQVPNEYKFQVLSNFLVNPDVEWWTFMSFDDRNYERPEFYKLVTREEVAVELEAHKKKLISFVKRVSDTHLKLTF